MTLLCSTGSEPEQTYQLQRSATHCPASCCSVAGFQSMSTTLESFCNLFKIRSPCLMAAWYCAFFASGLQRSGVQCWESTGHDEHTVLQMTHASCVGCQSKTICVRPPALQNLCNNLPVILLQPYRDDEQAQDLETTDSKPARNASVAVVCNSSTCWSPPCRRPCRSWRAAGRRR